MDIDGASSISMQNFLDFLKLSSRVHESISNKNAVDAEKQIDYTTLAKNELVNGLINNSKLSKSFIKTEIPDSENCDKNGK